MQQIQHVFTARANTQAGKNMLIKVFKFAARTERSESRLRVMADAIHNGLKRVDHTHDVWLVEGVMHSLERWRETLDDDAWARAGEISRRLAGSRLLAHSRLQEWSLASRGYVF